ncbi:coagulation factor XI [Pleuronectes platessa]|uniref:coagulation factor XI n=1 Tax=Pleuronectes platessa TaxID=8262 RepID=UPI00232A43AB|nr:coagulation factor XI [Pleuronectes platessa]
MGTCLILLGLLSICSLCFSQECAPELIENVDFPGSDITVLHSLDARHCQQLCTEHPSCLFFSFLRHDYTRDNRNFFCYLKSTPSREPNVRTPVQGITSGFSLKNCPSKLECAQELIENVDFPGTDINILYSPDARHCQQLCTEHPSCLFFSFLRHDWTRDNRNFFCYLKSTPSLKPNVRTPVQGITSGFSLKNCPSKLEQPCQSQLYQNVDFPGADYKSFFTSSVEECQKVCTQDPHCRFFAFMNGVYTPENTRYRCFLKHSWSVPRSPVIKKEVGAVSGFSHKLQMTQYFGTVCQGKIFLNTDIRGHDIDNLPAASAEHCQALCTDKPSCTYFSYNRGDFQCYLKGNPSVMVTSTNAVTTSGIPVHFCQMDNSWLQVSHEGVNFQGSDLRSELMDDPDKCQRTCTTDPLCQFYTYFHESYPNPDFRRRCYLKRVITAPAPPKVIKLNNIVSGFSLKNWV